MFRRFFNRRTIYNKQEVGNNSLDTQVIYGYFIGYNLNIDR